MNIMYLFPVRYEEKGDEGEATHREHTRGVFYPNTKHLWVLQIFNFVEN